MNFDSRTAASLGSYSGWIGTVEKVINEAE